MEIHEKIGIYLVFALILFMLFKSPFNVGDIRERIAKLEVKVAILQEKNK